MGIIQQGQAPPGAVTVPNPLFSTSPIPQGSCVLTGQFSEGLTITGNETKDITIDLSFSINNSVEWNEINTDGKFEPAAGEALTDMGLRGLIPYVTYYPLQALNTGLFFISCLKLPFKLSGLAPILYPYKR